VPDNVGLDAPGSAGRTHGGGLVDGMARIGHPDGGELILPGYSAYDVEILLEYAQWSAHRYGEVSLELASRIWRVATVSDRAATSTGCHQRRADLSFEGGVGELWLCSHCAQDELQGSHRRRG
jgi:hypothetical protein